MTLTLAPQQAITAAVAEHLDEFDMAAVCNTDGSYGPVQYGAGWNCCTGNETAVIVFDNRARWAVCSACANTYEGEVQPLPGIVLLSFPLNR